MKISKSYAHRNDDYLSSVMEVKELPISQKQQQNLLGNQTFRSILPLESRSHRSYGCINRHSFSMPKLCHIGENKYSEMAFSILQYQLKDSQARQTHLKNLKHNLERRLQSAKAQGNERLVALLTQESRELI